MTQALTRRQAIKAGGAAALWAFSGLAPAAIAGSNARNGAAANVYAGAFGDGRFLLPALPYAYNSLDPFYEESAIRLHHDAHHKAYVEGANAAMEQLRADRKEGNYDRVYDLSRRMAFHGSGHALHCLFWHSMIQGGGKPTSDFTEAINQSFGSFDAATKQFAAVANAIQGSGWAILAYEPVSRDMVILAAEKHQNETIWGVVPLLACDVWEHAYYSPYQSRRSEWIGNFMKISNWRTASDLYAQITTLA